MASVWQCPLILWRAVRIPDGVRQLEKVGWGSVCKCDASSSVKPACARSCRAVHRDASGLAGLPSDAEEKAASTAFRCTGGRAASRYTGESAASRCTKGSAACLAQSTRPKAYLSRNEVCLPMQGMSIRGPLAKGNSGCIDKVARPIALLAVYPGD
jgi:hypothetical protein